MNEMRLKARGWYEHLSVLALTLPALLLVSVVIFVPTGWLFGLSFIDDNGEPSFINYTRMIELPSYITVFKTTFMLSGLVTVLSVVIGYPLAYLLSQLSRRTANILLIAVLLPFWTSLLVRTYAWLVLLQRKGLINTALYEIGLIDEPLRLVHNFTGAAIGMTHIMVPFLILPLYASMRAIDPAYMRAATSLGASASRAFWDVFVPLAMPGLLAGAALVFVLCLGFFVTPALLGGGKVIMIAQQIDMNIRLYYSWGAASALGVVLVVASLLLIGLSAKLARLALGRGSKR